MSDDLPTGWQPMAVAQVFQSLRPADAAPHEAAEFEAELPAILPRFADDAEGARTDLAHLSGLLRASEDQAARLAERGFFKTLWTRLTGDAPGDAAAVRARLTEVQARAVAVTERLLTRQTWLAHATHYLGARAELMAMENARLKAVLVRLGERVFERVERLESRVERLERRSDGLERRIALSELFESGFSPALNRPYAQIEDPLQRLLTLAADFVRASGGDWRPIDLHRLQRLARGEAQLGDDVALPVEHWVHRALDLLAGPEMPLADWVRADALYERLMAPIDDETSAARAFYPLHFLLQRPQWFVAQGLPRSAAVAVIVEELGAYGLDTTETLSAWRFLQWLLEERLGWQLEAAMTAPEALPAPGAGGARLPLDGLAPQLTFLPAGRPVLLAMDGATSHPALYVAGPEGPKSLRAPPPDVDLATTTTRWAVDGDALVTLTTDRRGILRGHPSGGGDAPWRWETIGVPTSSMLAGVAARGGVLVAWDRTQVFQRDADGNRRQAPRAVLSAAVAADATYLLLRDHVQRWPEAGDPLEWARLPRGLQPAVVVATPDPPPRLCVRGRRPAGGTAIAALGPEPAVLPVDGDARLAPLPGGAVLVLVNGIVSRWRPRDGATMIPFDATRGLRILHVATDAQGHVLAVRADAPEALVVQG